MAIRYEGFVSNSMQKLQEITDFLGISAMPAEMLEKEWQIHEMNSYVVNINPAGLQRLDAEDFEKIQFVAGNMEKYGYTKNS